MVTIATALVRLWTRCYTVRMDAWLRDVRRAEIESDLWESLVDARERHVLALGLEIVARLLVGMPDDLLWRFEHASVRPASLRRAAWLFATGAALAVVALAALALNGVSPPAPPAAPAMALRELPPPPPPPPPPRPRGADPRRR